jgi:hypothetical protein
VLAIGIGVLDLHPFLSRQVVLGQGEHLASFQARSSVTADWPRSFTLDLSGSKSDREELGNSTKMIDRG